MHWCRVFIYAELHSAEVRRHLAVRDPGEALGERIDSDGADLNTAGARTCHGDADASPRVGQVPRRLLPLVEPQTG